MTQFNPTKAEGGITNGNRAGRGADALGHYKRHVMGESGPLGPEDVHDLVADLCHWLHREANPNPVAEIETGIFHWQEEK